MRRPRHSSTGTLSDLDFSQFKAGQLEWERKDARLTMRLPQPMLERRHRL